MTDFIKTMISRYCKNNKDMAECLCRDADNIAMRIRTAVQHERLGMVFVYEFLQGSYIKNPEFADIED